MLFNDFVHKHKLKNKATSNLKLYEVLKKIGLDSNVGIYLRDGDFSTSCGIVNLHPIQELIGCVISKIVILIHMAVNHQKIS